MEDESPSLVRSDRLTEATSEPVAPPTDELVTLLTAYAEALEFSGELPYMLLLKRRRTRLGRLVRVPRPRWLVRFFLVQHMRRTSGALKRRCYADRIAGRRVSTSNADLVTLTDFERSLPSTLSPRAGAFILALSVLFVSFLVADYALPNWRILSGPQGDAHVGSHSALLGARSGLFRGDSTLEQTVHVPKDARSTLTFWYLPHCPYGAPRVEMRMQIRSTDGSSLATVFKRSCSNAVGAWTRKRYDTSNFAARTVVFWFDVHSYGENSYFLLDDVRLAAVGSNTANDVKNAGFEKGNGGHPSSWTSSGRYEPVMSTRCNPRDPKRECLQDFRLRAISAKPLGTLTSATLTFDRNKAIGGFKSFGCVWDDKAKAWKDCRLSRVASSSSAAFVLVPLTIWALLLFIGIPPLRLKRLLFLVRPGSVDELRHTYAAEPQVAPANVYALEARAFAEVGTRRPRELSVDLFAQTMLMIPLLLLGLSAIGFTVWWTRHLIQLYTSSDFGVVDTYFIVYLAGFVLLMLIFTALVLLVAVGRLAELRRTARQRAASEEAPSAGRGATWPRRAAAQLIDLLCICALAALLFLLIRSQTGSDPAEGDLLLRWLVIVAVVSVGALVYHAAFALAPGSWKGRTLGTRALRLRVVLPDGTHPGLVRTLVRDVLLKWLLFLPLIVPALLNFLWPLWDYRRRAFHDIVAGTVIAREQREPEPATEDALTSGLMPEPST